MRRARDEEAAQVAEHLVGEGLASGWGLRTLSAEMAGVQPHLLPRGLGLAARHRHRLRGLRRYGLDEAATRLAADVIDAMPFFAAACPSSTAATTAGPTTCPIPYPNACSPQAWAAAVPLEPRHGAASGSSPTCRDGG